MEVVVPGDMTRSVAKKVHLEHCNFHPHFRTEHEGHMYLHEVVQEPRCASMIDLLGILDHRGTPQESDIVHLEVLAKYHYCGCCKERLGGPVMFHEVRKVSQGAPGPKDASLVLMT